MRNTFVAAVVALMIISFLSCRKCYVCHNQCQVCRKERPDTTLTIIVASEKLSLQYYTEYIDSLTSPALGWACHDTASNYAERYCTTQGQADQLIFTKHDAGLFCTSE